jgi:hypothetical protein
MECLTAENGEAGEAVTAQTCIREVLGSNLGRDNGYPDVFRRFPQFLRYLDNTSVRPQPHPSEGFLIHPYSLKQTTNLTAEKILRTSTRTHSSPWIWLSSLPTSQHIVAETSKQEQQSG